MITGADLFCGAGGTSTGLLAACRELGVPVQLFALNHWQVAINTHEQNHPGVRHLWADIEGVEPRKVVPSGKLRILVASPECIYFSRARGGKPVNDQRRSSASYVLQWAQELDIEDLLIENVREFEDWGPLYPDDHPDTRLRNRPIPARKGEHFRQFVADLRALGYRVEHRVLRAADYGDATTRERFFLRARKGGGAITWPTPTHARENWRSAREIIDWSVKGTSIYGRKKPLCPATMRRNLAGLRKFSKLEPYLVEYHGDHPGTRSGERRHRSLDEPLATQDTSNRFGLAQPYLVKLYGGHDACALDDPLPTITASFEHYGLAEPYLVVLRNHADAMPMHGPLPTLCAEGQHMGLAQPYLVKYYGTGGAVSVDDPLDTITTVDRFGVSQPRLVDSRHAEHLLRALDDPDPLYRPQVVEINGTTYLVDILYRMLLPRELAAAMSFPEHYFFSGTQGDQVKQIGNSVPVRLAKALCLSILADSNEREEIICTTENERFSCLA